MGLLSRAENAVNVGVVNAVDGADKTGGDASQPALKKIKIPKKNLDVLKKKISEYQKVYRIFDCIIFKNQTNEKGKADICEKLTKAAGDMGITIPINDDHALILLPSEMDRELIAHRLSKILNAEPVLSFRAVNPEYVIDRLNSLTYA